MMAKKWNEKKYIELCNQREMKMYEMRLKGVPFSERRNAVKEITEQIESL